MSEYFSCGVKLGWLINPDQKTVEIYRLDQDTEIVTIRINSRSNRYF
ncbi:MAG: Uma2 family endonuclease [Cyanobacteria bacterium J06631_2]